MTFIFSCLKQYFTHSLRSFVKYCFHHSKIKVIPSRRRVISSIYWYIVDDIIQPWQTPSGSDMLKLNIRAKTRGEYKLFRHGRYFLPVKHYTSSVVVYTIQHPAWTVLIGLFPCLNSTLATIFITLLVINSGCRPIHESNVSGLLHGHLKS